MWAAEAAASSAPADKSGCFRMRPRLSGPLRPRFLQQELVVSVIALAGPSLLRLHCQLKGSQLLLPMLCLLSCLGLLRNSPAALVHLQDPSSWRPASDSGSSGAADLLHRHARFAIFVAARGAAKTAGTCMSKRLPAEPQLSCQQRALALHLASHARPETSNHCQPWYCQAVHRQLRTERQLMR